LPVGCSRLWASLATSAQLLNYVFAWADDNLPLYEKRGHEAGKGDVFRHDEDHRLILAALSQADPTGPPDANAANRDLFTLGSVHERTGEQLTLSGSTTTNSVALNPRYGYTSYGADTNRRRRGMGTVLI
jgi:hypothetical protein